MTHNRYQVRQLQDGFVLEGRSDRPSIQVRLESMDWVVCDESSKFIEKRSRFGLFEVYRLIDRITEESMSNWSSPMATEPHWAVREWATQKARRSIAAIIKQERDRLLQSNYEARVFETQKAVFAACFGCCQLVRSPLFYQFASSGLLSDIKRYRAAACAVSIVSDNLLPVNDDNLLDKQVLQDEPTIRSACNSLERWRDLYSDTGRSYAALNRTLDNLPGQIPFRLLGSLTKVHLLRAVADRVELLTLLSSLDRYELRHFRVFHFATRSEIARAMQLVANEFRMPFSHRKSADIMQMVGYLYDYPHPHAGNIVGLAERSIRNHREEAAQEVDTLLYYNEDNETPVQFPPIPVPQIPGLTFLDTVSKICREGLLMKHCIASYIDSALYGDCFLFHYDFEGESASIEVNRNGKVRQSFGPRNTQNQASIKGSRILSKWGKKFRFCADSSSDPTSLHALPF